MRVHFLPSNREHHQQESRREDPWDTMVKNHRTSLCQEARACLGKANGRKPDPSWRGQGAAIRTNHGDYVRSNVLTGHQCLQVKAGAQRRPPLHPLRHGPNTSPCDKPPSKLPSCILHFLPSSPETGALKMQTSPASKETIFEENKVMEETPNAK